MAILRKTDDPALVGARIEPNALMRMVYLWMGLGLLVTTVTAIFISNNEALLQVAANLYIFAIIGTLILVLALSALIFKMSVGMATTLFFVYAGVNGLTFAFVFLAYDLGSIAAAFGTTAVLFGVMTVVGFTTSVDLTRYRTYFLMGLFGLIIAMFVNMFLLQSGPLDLMISIFGVVLFTALTAYDTQRILRIAEMPEVQADGNIAMKLSILGALTLYLDFINLFLFLLRIFGGGRD